MMKIPIAELWNNLTNRTLLDARTPAEFDKGHIPRAINFPLFSNEEKVIVGTIYKQVSPEKALIKGLELVGPKMADFVKTAIQIAPNRKVMLHCWRGGKRSESLAWLLTLAAFDVITIEGGYKSYRAYIQEQFNHLSLQLIVLGGKTGSGKTAILQQLAAKGEQIIDLEALAAHKGSAFGWIGEPQQPKTERFENDLFEATRTLHPTKRIWVENESKGIGTVRIPDGFWNLMKSSPLINLEVPFDCRVNHLMDVYTHTNHEDLIASFQKIEKRIGNEMTKKAKEALEIGDFKTAAGIGLKYYDKLYSFGFDTNPSPSKYILEIPDNNYNQTADDLINFANNNIHSTHDS